jgi:hypothetical protein
MIVCSAAGLEVAQRGKPGLLAVILFINCILLYGNNRTACHYSHCVYIYKAVGVFSQTAVVCVIVKRKQ